MCSFPQFSSACSDILVWNFTHDFLLMYYRASSSVVTMRQFLKELFLFVNLEYRKYRVFRTFLLLALRCWAEILHMTLFLCRLRSIAAHRDHFVRRLSVCACVCLSDSHTSPHIGITDLSGVVCFFIRLEQSVFNYPRATLLWFRPSVRARTLWMR